MKRVETFGTAEGCWEWTGKIAKCGYGYMSFGHRIQRRAHRVSYELVHSELPAACHQLVVDHLCGNKLCVNPLHLELTTQRQNVRRARMTREVTY